MRRVRVHDTECNKERTLVTTLLNSLNFLFKPLCTALIGHQVAVIIIHIAERPFFTEMPPSRISRSICGCRNRWHIRKRSKCPVKSPDSTECSRYRRMRRSLLAIIRQGPLILFYTHLVPITSLGMMLNFTRLIRFVAILHCVCR